MGYCIPCFGPSKHRSKSISKTHVVVPSDQRLGTCETRQPTKATRREVEKRIENFSQKHGSCETRQPTMATRQEVEKKIEYFSQRHGISEPQEPTKGTKQEVAKKIEPMVDSKNKHEEQPDGVLVIKKVTLDLNVKTHEEFPTNQIRDPSVALENDREKGNKNEATQSGSQAQSDSSMSSVFTYPPSHGYHNCTSSDDDDDEGESEAMESLESDSDDNQESDSLFSICLESRNHVSAPEIDEKEVNSPIPASCSLVVYGLKSIGLKQNDRRKDLGTVLNPIENLTQLTQLKDQEKENININMEELIDIPISEELHLKFSNGSKSQIDDVAVDTSLSSWLVESERTSISKNSPNDSVGNSPGMVKLSRGSEGRQILGALTVEEHR